MRPRLARSTRRPCRSVSSSSAQLSPRRTSRARNGSASSSSAKSRNGKRRSKPAAPARTDGAKMADIKIYNPEGLAKPLGQYSHVTRVKASEYIFIAGQVSADKDGKLVGPDDFDAQCVQTFA